MVDKLPLDLQRFRDNHRRLSDEIAGLFEVERRRAGLDRRGPELSSAGFRRPGQIELFESA